MLTTLGEVILIKDINPSIYNYSLPNSSYIENEAAFKNKLYFSANDGVNGAELWVSDGTTAGTKLLKDIFSGLNSYEESNSSIPEDFTVFNNKLYFNADDGINGRELWVTDGTTEGTRLLFDINPGSSENYSGNFYIDSSEPGGFIEFNNKLYFSANDGVNGRELWITDGTTEGTQLVKDIFPGISNYDYPNNSNPGNLTLFKNKLYFTADDDVNGTGLWVTDGTESGTQLVADIVGDEPYGPDPTNFVICNDKIYFIARDRVHGVELWVTDGTESGTQLVKDIFPGIYEGYFGPFPNGSFPENLTVLNNKLYFTANDGVNGRELWVSDGTESGTQLVKNINPDSGKYSSTKDPRNLTLFNNKIYFTANDGVNGGELWVTNGTKNGTQLFKDIIPGSEGSFDYYDSGFLTVFNDKLYFTTDDSVNNTELWVSDGTQSGTQFVDDINPGSPNSYAGELTVVGKELFIVAGNNETGQELFKLNVDNSNTITDTTPQISINDISITEGNQGNTELIFTVTLDAASEETITVDFTTEDGTAVAGEDYTTANGTLEFAPEEIEKTITIQVNGDTIVEEDESFNLNLSNASGATISDNQGTATIINNNSTELQTIELFRFRNTTFESKTYVFVGAEERDAIQNNPDLNQTFELENNGNAAFIASIEDGDDLIPFYRIKSLDIPGTYLFVSTVEYDGIFAEDSAQRDKWVKEGFNDEGDDLAEFYLLDGSANRGIEFNRFQNTENGTFLYANPEETATIESDLDLSNLFINQGEAFELIE